MRISYSSAFPEARIIANPEITALSIETQKFNHACLSVPCANRCEVKSPMEIAVAYQDPMQDMTPIHGIYKGIDAVVLWHELVHILEGKTYIDITLESLSSADLDQFQKMLLAELKKRTEQNYLPDLTAPPFHFTVKIKRGVPKLDPQELANVLSKMTDETLSGLFCQASLLVKSLTHLHKTNSD